MSLEMLFKLNPYDDDQVEKISSFEKENNISGIIENINKIRSISKEEYFNNKKESNEIEETLFIEKENKITDCCFIQGEKDRKVCRIIYCDIINKSKKRNLPILATDYAFTNLKMEEVFIDVFPEDIDMQKYLELKGFECLGDNNGKIAYLKDREEKENNRRMI